jgi:membrane associated rhomboid family serine protease
MGLYDRDYTQADFEPGHSYSRYSSQMRFSLPRLTPVVKWLMIVNVGIFLVAVLIPPLQRYIYEWFELDARSAGRALQVWRLVTYQFLHDPTGIFHIVLNMIGLFFLGPPLEQHWGSRRFLSFYLGCGIAGAILYYLLVALRLLPPIPMVGASGAILGILAACAILFPRFVIILGIFPVPIRIGAVILTAAYLYTVVTNGGNAGGDAAHLGGMAAGAIYVFSQSWRDKFKLKLRAGQWEKRMASQRNLQAEVDRILKKVHDSGLQSLTRKEKSTLKEATKAEQMRNRF